MEFKSDDFKMFIGTFVMLVHGLIHDGQLRACPCALLRLMYDLR